MKRPINKEWHINNRMPENATEQQRLVWHLEHQKVCACRPIPSSLLEQANIQTKPAKKAKKNGRL